MTNFEKASAFVLQNEGGYEPPSDDDPGGETNFGISKRAYPDEDIRRMTPQRACEIYRRDFWRFDEVRDDDLATKMLDVCVQFGLGEGVRLIERALAPFFRGQAVAIDGVFGPLDLRMVNQCTPADLLREIRARQAQRYCQDLKKNPAEMPESLGFFRRAVQ
jgi:lysozyme family protein